MTGRHRATHATSGTLRRCSEVAAAVAVTALCLLPIARADAAAGHNPFGYLDQAKATSATAIVVSGWAADPDNVRLPITVSATVDGKASGSVVTSLARPDVAKARGTGPSQGFKTTLTTTKGTHSVCLVMGNRGRGANTTLACRTITMVGSTPPMTPGQIAAHSPSGALESVAAATSVSIRLTGWASDPDNRQPPLKIIAYLDGKAVATVDESVSRPDLVKSHGTGPTAGFAFNVRASAGSHIACAWAVNSRIGYNTPLGCAGVSTPAVAMPTGPTPATPAANTKIVKYAAKFLGGKYVWGAENPAVGFDCSGLVQYSYAKAAGVTTPRVSQDQFHAARMITAGRAVPGDLVFYHDNTGSVYHVGIYTGPGTTYAAVDEAEGIRVQKIWDATVATYGSFTHS